LSGLANVRLIGLAYANDVPQGYGIVQSKARLLAGDGAKGCICAGRGRS